MICKYEEYIGIYQEIIPVKFEPVIGLEVQVERCHKCERIDQGLFKKMRFENSTSA